MNLSYRVLGWVYAIVGGHTLASACSFVAPPQNTSAVEPFGALPPSSTTTAVFGEQRIRSWVAQLSAGLNTKRVMEEVLGLHWGTELADTTQASEAVLALVDVIGAKLSSSGVAYIMNEVDRSQLSMQTKLAVMSKMFVRFKHIFRTDSFECTLHLDEALRDMLAEDLAKTTVWSKFNTRYAAALVISGDSRVQDLLQDQQARLPAIIPASNSDGLRDKWLEMADAIMLLLEYSHAQQSQATLRAALFGESNIGRYPSSPQCIWAMRRLLLMGMPAAELRADILGHVNQLWTDGVALTSGTDFQERQRGGLMRRNAADWKAAGIKIGVLTASDAPIVPAPLRNPGCR
jgi:hypothetical protein